METSQNVHIGRNIRKIRELLDIKQDGLAQAINVSQQTISTIENSEFVESFRLKEIADALGLTSEAIQKFSEDYVLKIISSTPLYEQINEHNIFNTCTYPPFNAVNKIFELYERLLQSEKDKINYLEKIANQNTI